MEKIPALLTRSSDLGPEKEGQLYTKTYEKLYNRLMANPEDTEARLQMAELFIMEARITESTLIITRQPLKWSIPFWKVSLKNRRCFSVL